MSEIKIERFFVEKCYLKQVTLPFSPAEIAKKCGLGYQDVWNTLQKMCAKKILDKFGNGKYKLNREYYNKTYANKSLVSSEFNNKNKYARSNHV